MPSVTNKALNTGSVANKAIHNQTSNPTWDEATFTWDAAQGTWDEGVGFGVTNKALNTGSVTNKAISP